MIKDVRIVKLSISVHSESSFVRMQTDVPRYRSQ
jgi:hypothetical protein